MSVKLHPLFPEGSFNLCLDDKEIDAIRAHVNDPLFRDFYYFSEGDTEQIAI